MARSELIFNTEAAPWRGDLGAFLRDRITPTMTFARVRVQGSGPHRFTPVKLPRGLRLEIRVEPYSQAEPPTWSPAGRVDGNGAHRASRRCPGHRKSGRSPRADGEARAPDSCRGRAPGSLAVPARGACFRGLRGRLDRISFGHHPAAACESRRAAVLVLDRSPGLPADRLRADHGWPRASGGARARARRTLELCRGRIRDGDRTDAGEGRQSGGLLRPTWCSTGAR